MHVIVWEYTARPDVAETFAGIYAPDGDWARLFRQSEGYLGSSLYRATDDATQFVSVDRWTSAAAFDGFMTSFREAYEELDRRCGELTVREHRLGAGEA